MGLDPKGEESMTENPASLVKTKRDERIWREATWVVEDSYGIPRSKSSKKKFWGTVTNLFKKMKAKYRNRPLPSYYGKP